MVCSNMNDLSVKLLHVRNFKVVFWPSGKTFYLTSIGRDIVATSLISHLIIASNFCNLFHLVHK